MTRRTAGYFLLCAFLLLTACGTLPDAQPFQDATRSLSSAVKASGQAFDDSLDEATANSPANATQYGQLKKTFDQAWAARIAAAEGAVDYSNAVAELVSAARTSEDSVSKLSDALQGLATASSIPLAQVTASTGTDIARFLVAQIAVVRTSQKLDDAMTAAQPAVDRIAARINQDLNDQLIPSMTDVYKNNVGAIKRKYTADDNFAQSFSFRRDDMRKKVLNKEADASRLVDLDRVQDTVNTSLKARDKELDQLSTAYATRLRLLRLLASATTVWADSHRELARAIQDKRKVDVSRLQEAIMTVRAITQKLEAL
ncbi:hypothetical protein K2O51_33600 (plasmid) [Cupriavidus pinatubonensis]|uniref:hypothetical protein n=1 Tax=Cupriavidus pinatubonensis TaxID=248026 RepID=UPI001C72F166|nr:hypothetical protein [Cupriavidus pinatubonensis]QYY33783.1 hypothetical protein K2O51_33600 [Cupriavidus pinatubonensis]